MEVYLMMLGFFRLLKDSGVNWVRIRVWNRPYDSSEMVMAAATVIWKRQKQSENLLRMQV